MEARELDLADSTEGTSTSFEEMLANLDVEVLEQRIQFSEETMIPAGSPGNEEGGGNMCACTCSPTWDS